MRNREQWQPSKYVYRNHQLRASRDKREVQVFSRLMSDLIAARYDRHLREHCRGRLVDLGCGKVPFCQAYEALIDENICVDWAGSRHTSPHLDLEANLTSNLPFGDASFDTIVLADVLEHIPVPEKLWCEMARILVPNGVLFVNAPFIYGLHETPHDYYRYTEFAFRRFADISNMKIIRLEPIGGLLEVLTDVYSKVVSQLPLAGPLIASSIQGMTFAFGKTGLGRQASVRTGRIFPLGYFLIARKPSV